MTQIKNLFSLFKGPCSASRRPSTRPVRSTKHRTILASLTNASRSPTFPATTAISTATTSTYIHNRRGKLLLDADIVDLDKLYLSDTLLFFDTCRAVPTTLIYCIEPPDVQLRCRDARSQRASMAGCHTQPAASNPYHRTNEQCQYRVHLTRRAYC